MSELDKIVKLQIDQLSKVEISTDLIDRIDIGKLSNKAKSLVKALSESNESLEELINKGKFKSFIHSLSGKNDRTLANAEKAVVDSTQFNIGLSLLLVLFAKAIKNQQDDILAIQGLTKEQADKIVEILQAGEFVKRRIEEARDELESNISALGENLSRKIDEINGHFENTTNDIKVELQNLLRKEDEKILAEIRNLGVIVDKLKDEDIIKLQQKNHVLDKKILLAVCLSLISFVLLILKIFNAI